MTGLSTSLLSGRQGSAPFGSSLVLRGALVVGPARGTLLWGRGRVLGLNLDRLGLIRLDDGELDNFRGNGDRV